MRISGILRLVGLYILIGLAGCGDPIGTPCAIQGSGFHASDECRHRCLQYRKITCPGGDLVNPHICSGPKQCVPGSCPDGQTCYHIADPFNEESYCVPSDVCGAMNAAQLRQWENQSAAIASKLRTEYEARRERRMKGSASSPADVPN